MKNNFKDLEFSKQITLVEGRAFSKWNWKIREFLQV